MARRKSDSPQKAALREIMSNYLKENDVHIKDGTDVNSIMRDMMSIILEGTLDAEMNEELGYSRYDYKNKETDNSRNGYSKKTMHTSYGDMEVDVPRDRKGEFEPQVIKKYQNIITQDMEEEIISMYAKGMTTADIESHMRDLYDIESSDSTISRITDKILPIVKEWQERMAGTSAGRSLCDCFHGRDPLPPYCETSRLHCYRYRYVRQKRCSGHVRWGKRERKILAFHHEQPEESRCGGDTDHLRRWPDRFPTGNRSRLSACGGPAVYYPPDPQFYEICIIQGLEKTHGRFEKSVYSSR